MAFHILTTAYAGMAWEGIVVEQMLGVTRFVQR